MITAIRSLALAAILSLLGGSVFGSGLEEARRLLGEGEHEAAIAAAEQAPAGVDRSIVLATIHAEAGQHDAALRYARQAVKQAPDNAEAHLSQAVALRGKLRSGSKIKAMMSIGGYKKSLRTALELAPDHPEVREEEIGFLMMAPGVAGGDKERALERARELAAIDADRGASMQIEALMALERNEEAYELMRERLEASPEDARQRYRLAFLLQRDERWSEADREFRRLVDGESFEARYRYGSLYQLGRSRVLGRYELEQAVGYFDRFVAEAPDDLATSRASALWRKGMALEALDRVDQARASYRAALELEPDHEQAKSALRKIGKR